MCNIINNRCCHIPDILCRNCVLDAHDILVCNRITCRRLKLDALRHIEIHEEMLHNNFCHLISCMRYHAIGYDTSISCDRDITRSGSHIDKCDIKHTIVLRNCHIDSGDRLQCHIGYTKPGLSHCRIQSVYHILRQKCNYDILAYFVCLMTFKADKHLIIQKKFDCRISHTVKLIACIVNLLEFLLCFFYAKQVKRMDILAGHHRLLRILILHMRRDSL